MVGIMRGGGRRTSEATDLLMFCKGALGLGWWKMLEFRDIMLSRRDAISTRVEGIGSLFKIAIEPY